MYAVVKLLIPAEAKRNSATTYRCRADKAKVLQIERADKMMIIDGMRQRQECISFCQKNWRNAIRKAVEYKRIKKQADKLVRNVKSKGDKDGV